MSSLERLEVNRHFPEFVRRTQQNHVDHSTYRHRRCRALRVVGDHQRQGVSES